MEKRYLIPLSNRIESINILNEDDDVFRRKVNYTIRFGKQPIKLGQFIPCDLEGNVLEEPEDWDAYLSHDDSTFRDTKGWIKEIQQYQEAQERVIFKGFEVESFIDKVNPCYNLSNGTERITMHLGLYNFNKGNFVKTLENLTHLNLELTDNALNK